MDLRFSFYLIGIAYAAIPLTVWYILRSRAEDSSALYWCVGNGLFAVTLLLMGGRAFIPEWVGYSAASAIGYLSYALRLASVQMVAGESRQRAHRVLYLALLLGGAGFVVDWLVGYQRNSVLINSLLQTGFSAGIAWHAHRIYKHDNHRDFLLVVIAYALMALALGWRAAVLDLDITRTGVAGHEVSIFVVFTAALGCVILGNVGFVGHALRRYELLLERNQVRLVEEQAGRAAVEQIVEEKQRLLDKLSSLLNQREIVTQKLVADILKPMQLMSNSLDNFTDSLQQRGDSTQLVSMAIQLQTLLRRVSTTASNAVAHARYLQDKSEVFRQEIEIQLVNDLILADLSPDERSRVNAAFHLRSQTIRIDFELYRIAILNLVSRALEHGEGCNQVSIVIDETDHPACLLWMISSAPTGATPVDEGWPGGVWQGSWSKIQQPAEDLGCQVAHRAIALHKGELFKHETEESVRFLVRMPYE